MRKIDNFLKELLRIYLLHVIMGDGDYWHYEGFMTSEYTLLFYGITS